MQNFKGYPMVQTIVLDNRLGKIGLEPKAPFCRDTQLLFADTVLFFKGVTHGYVATADRVLLHWMFSSTV